MRLIDAHARLLEMDQPVFRTAEAAACLRIENARASKMLGRLADVGLLEHLPRALWALPDKTDRLILPTYLAAPFPCCISLQTALYHHGIVSQIPDVIYAVSPARTKRFFTSMGVISIHHIAPTFFGGFDMDENGIFMATPEKALLDLLYLSPAKSRLFCAWPELDELPRLRVRELRTWIRRIDDTRRRTCVIRKLAQIGIITSDPA